MSHAAHLEADIARLGEEMDELSRLPRPENSVGFLVKAEIAPDVDANVGGLGDKRTESVVVDRTPDGALIHNMRADLRPLRRKIAQYGDPEQTTASGGRKNLRLVAPLENLRLATLADLSDGWLSPATLDPAELVWVELWAGGGELASAAHRLRVQVAIIEFLGHYELSTAALDPFAATEHDIYMLELSGAALMDLPTQMPDVYHLSPPERPSVPALLDPHTGPAIPEMVGPDEEATVVAVLDTGVAERHPLLEPALAAPGTSSIPGEESATDQHGHGTRMAGVALYGNLTIPLGASGPLRGRCRLQNQRILLGGEAQPTTPEFMLDRTRDAVLEAEATAAPRRVFNLSVGAPTARPGDRTAWGGAVDLLAYHGGRGRLISVAAGNEPLNGAPIPADYPARNLVVGLCSPGEALNAITVGAMTDLDAVAVAEPPRVPFSAKGQLGPVSRGDVGGSRAIKPEVVAEGGNLSTNGSDARADPDLQVLTTSHEHAIGPWLGLTAATSAATAEVSGMLAEIWSANPMRWPQTIRALLVHSARWSDAMRAQFPVRQDRVRAFGYGRPDAVAASRSILERPTLILEQRLYPERRVEGGREMHFIRLPLPDAELLALAELEVEISVTLSYFVEPNENRFRRYQSAGLRWGLQRPLEDEDDFRKRINRLEREQDGGYEDGSEDLPWEIGPQARGRGTVQSDRARIAAAALADARALAVWPVSGWWRDRELREEVPIAYSLVVTIDAGEAGADLYTPILNEISIQTEIGR
ncbi:MAG: S8 family peptidase [Actinobacteria bacterium]|nr:S8 family peptidase [Actinomycetota bacterium]